MLFVFGLIAAEYAYATDVTVSGSIRIRGAVLHESDFDKSDYDSENTAYTDQRTRLKVKAVVTPNTMGVIELESGSNTSDVVTWGPDTGYSSAMYAKGDAKMGALYVRQAYILHTGSGLLGKPAGFRVGHQLLKFGNGLFFDHTKYGDDAIVLFVEPQKGTDVTLLTIKLQEGTSTSENDDATVYFLGVEHQLDNVNLSADVAYLDDQGFVPDPGKGLHFWNIGLRGDTEVGDIALRADVEVQTGKSFGTTTDTDRRYKGYAVLIGADFKLSDVDVGIEGAYGSGDEIDTAKYEGYVTLPHATGFAYLYDDKVATAAISPTGTLGGLKAGINNTQYLKFYASKELTPELKAKAAIYLLKASKIQSATYNSRDIGTELDATVTYNIDKNLNYYVEGGYLVAGDMYKNQTSGRDPDNVYGIRHGIILEF
jgi:hypothetical protein